MKLGIVGSRRRNTKKDKKIVKDIILKLKPKLIVSGGCTKGADKFAEELSEELNIPIKIHYPSKKNVTSYFTTIGSYYSRNEKIANNSDLLLALAAKDRKGGTENTIKYFLKKHNKSELIIL